PAPFEQVRPHARVGDALEPGELVAVVEDDLAHPLAIDVAVRSDLPPPALDKSGPNFLVIEQIVGDAIRRERRRTEPLEGGQHLGLPRPDAPGKADEAGQSWVGGGSSAGVSS